MSRRAYDVCAASVSDLPFDARVWKEAKSLARSGRSFALLGCRYEVESTQRRNEDGVDVVEVPFGSRTGSTSTLQRAGVLLRLWAEILRTPARTYHSHNIEVGPPCWLAARLRRARLVYDAHELYFEGMDEGGFRAKLAARLSALVERFMFRVADEAISTNRSRADVLSERYGRPGIAVLQNVPAPVEDVEPIDPGYPEGRRILLYQGHIVAEQRAFRETIKALRHFDDLDFAIIGYAREARIQMVRDWAAEEGVADRVHIYGPRPFEELVSTAACATVGLVPIYPFNLNTYLGDTNKIFEYLMAGIPVVASDLPEIRRVATDGDPPVGEVFDPYSPESIAAALHSVLDDPERYEARCREARRLALAKYNWSIEEQRLLELYSNGAQAGTTVAKNADAVGAPPR